MASKNSLRFQLSKEEKENMIHFTTKQDTWHHLKALHGTESMKFQFLRLIFGLIISLVLVGCIQKTSPPDTYDQFKFFIDRSIKPSQPKLPGLNCGPLRLVGVSVGPNDKQDEFVVNEVVFRPKNQDELRAFLEEYNGTILRDGTPILIPGATQIAVPEPSGWYLIQVDLNRSSLDDFLQNMTDAKLGGTLVFSSKDAARLIALIARETRKGWKVSPNFVTKFCTVKEHPISGGGNLNAETWWWMTEDDNSFTPGTQGLSIGVINSWNYLWYLDIPPSEGGTWEPAHVAIIDVGFALDESTGIPLNGNIDYLYLGLKPLQFDLVDYDGSAGGINSNSGSPWHGQGTFGVAAAYPRNLYGSAGTGGEFVRAILIKIDASHYMLADAIRSAAINGADVISLSWGSFCGWFCQNFPNLFDDPHEAEDVNDYLQDAVYFAVTYGAIVIAGAGNDTVDISTDNVIPCKLEGVICVGSIDQNKMNVYNWGDGIDIWAPTGIYSTVAPNSADRDIDNLDTDELQLFTGTSASAPFVSGIVGLMKVLNPSLFWSEVQTILQNTANMSPDSKVDPGYVDAFRAVEMVIPNEPPTVSITYPSDGAALSWRGRNFEG